MNITSRKNAQIQHLRLLQRERGHREETGEFVVEGAKMCTEAVKSGMEITAGYISADAAIRYADAAALLETATTVNMVSNDVSECISDTKTPQGIYATVRRRFSDFAELCEKKTARLLILDGLQDAGNVGTIIRTCDAFSLDGLVVSQNCADVYSPKVVRGTMGSLFRLPVFCCNLTQALENLTKSGYNVYAAMLDGAAARLGEAAFPEKTAVVIGNEGNGISSEVAEKCSSKIYIPMSNAESLNAAVAAAVICWEMRKQED